MKTLNQILLNAVDSDSRSDKALSLSVSSSPRLIKRLRDGILPSGRTLEILCASLGVTFSFAGMSSFVGSIHSDSSTPAKATVDVEGLAACGEMGFEEAGLNLLRANLPPGCSNQTFALLAVGTSLDPLGISAGHLCFCDPEVDADIGDIVFLEINNDTPDEPNFINDSGAPTLSDHRFSLKKLYKIEADMVVVYGYKRGKELPSIGKYGKESQEMFFSEIARKNIVRMVAVSWINARPRIV